MIGQVEAKEQAVLEEEVKKKEDTGEKIQLIVFNLGDEEYAVPIEQVKEIVPTPKISPVPQTPEYVVGIANIRGQVLSIINLEQKFGFQRTIVSATDKRNTSFILVIEHEETSIGVVVNQVPTTFAVPVSKIDSSDTMMQHSTMDASVIKGVANTQGRLIILIDILRMLEIGEIKTKKG